MELNLIKERIQNEAVEAWLKANRRGTLALATGTGKTFCFFKALLKTLNIGVDDKFSILFLAETTQRQMDLEADLIKFSKLVDKNILNFKIEFACYQSAYKWEGKYFDFVCADRILSA